MKKVILTILLILLGAAALAGAGFTGYQMGYRHGAATSLKNDEKSFHRFHHFGKEGNPTREFHQFSPGFQRKVGPGGFGISHHGRGFGFVSPFAILAKIAVLGLIVWLAYSLFKGNGWQLTLARVSPPVKPAKAMPPEKPKKGKQ